jgi:hypothetical protein
MREYVVIKKGSNIHHCINLPDDLMDLDLEIKIRPLIKVGKISEKLENLYSKYPDTKPFGKINNPQQWQRDIRDEWI